MIAANRADDLPFDEVVRRARYGQLMVGVDRFFARRFYTDVSLIIVQEHTGEAPYLEKALVLGAFVGGPLALLASAVLAVLVVGWWSALAIPLGSLLWFSYYGMSSRGGARLTSVSFLLVAAAVLYALSSSENRPLWGLASLYLAALWLGRFVYSGSTALLRGFVLRNPKAFEWLRDHLVLRELR